MSVQLLDKTRKINKLLHNNNSGKVVFNDICEVLSEILHSNILVISKKGHAFFATMLEAIRNRDRVPEQMKKMLDKGIRFVSIEDKAYPERLLTMVDPPLGLFYRGELPRDGLKSAAIIGARTCSEYGRNAAYSFGRYLAQNGVQVISGMALGADGAGQWGALSAGGKSYAVLGSGADICYPQEHFPLYEKLCAEGGVISEYPPGTPGLAFRFPRRNRIISALSDCVIVIEARKKSGTMTTVDHALNQGKEVFALPGRYNDPMSQGCNMLIKQGAGRLSGRTRRARSSSLGVDMYDFDEFRSVIKALRHPETGCPWDRVQTHETLIPCLIEETYEVIEGIRIWQDSADAENFCEELGDLLLQVVMQSQIASEEGLFTLDDVINNVCDKMYRRHPHVFGDVVANDADSALASWETAKGKEKGKDQIKNQVEAVPVSFPALYGHRHLAFAAYKGQ